jgi:hypothetical protein
MRHCACPSGEDNRARRDEHNVMGCGLTRFYSGFAEQFDVEVFPAILKPPQRNAVAQQSLARGRAGPAS